MRFSSARGTAVLEFTLCLPALVVFVVGIIDYGFGLRDTLFIAQASRAGARAAARMLTTGAPSCSDIAAEAQRIVRAELHRSEARDDLFSVAAPEFKVMNEDNVTFTVMEVRIQRKPFTDAFPSVFPGSVVSSKFRLEKALVCG